MVGKEGWGHCQTIFYMSLDNIRSGLSEIEEDAPIRVSIGTIKMILAFDLYQRSCIFYFLTFLFLLKNQQVDGRGH